MMESIIHEHNIPSVSYGKDEELLLGNILQGVESKSDNDFGNTQQQHNIWWNLSVPVYPVKKDLNISQKDLQKKTCRTI